MNLFVLYISLSRPIYNHFFHFVQFVLVISKIKKDKTQYLQEGLSSGFEAVEDSKNYAI